MIYLLDTNILLHYIRKTEFSKKIDEIYAPFSSKNEALVSVVSLGEIKAIAEMNNWGEKKRAQWDDLLNLLLIADINADSVINKYAEIDSFSQGRLTGAAFPFSARNMGKNDLWIAATTSVLGATLLTTDKDFNHLNDIYFPVLGIE